MGKAHTKEFKEEAVKLALSSDQPQSQTAKALGISKALLYSWVKAHREPKETTELMNANHSIQQENKRLRKELEQTKKERDYNTPNCQYNYF